MSSRWSYRTLEEATASVLRSSHPVDGWEQIELQDSLGRVLHGDVHARLNIPPWNRSTVDGYAVRSSDTAEGVETKLKIAGQVRAGEFYRGRVRAGECVRIATGAPIPDGADASVMFEKVREGKESISFAFLVSPMEEVSRLGVDIRKGELVAKRNSCLSVGTIGAIASQGLKTARVRRKPVVAVIPGGDEIATLGSRARRGQIYDVNSSTIAAIVEKSGGRAVRLPAVTDEREKVRKTLLSSLRYDAVVFSSGSSVGQRDFVAGTIREEGRLLFHGVRVRPGRPTMFGIVRGKPVFGLAGHPVSAFLGAHYLLSPSVRRMAGLPEATPATVQAVYDGNAREDRNMMHILPVEVKGNSCLPVFKESGAITSISRANGLVKQPAGTVISKGDKVAVEMLN